jgi:prenyltransferase beta subunit
MAACASAAAAAVCAAVVAWSPGPAGAKPSSAIDQTRLDNAVRYLQNAQNINGGFAGNPGGTPTAEFTAWAALALAAAGINPQDQAREGCASAYVFLTAQAGALSATTDFERELLVVDAAGTHPEDFGGVPLVKEILGRQLHQGAEAGAFTHEAGGSAPGAYDTIFAILALSPIHEPATETAVSSAAGWLERLQDPHDGGWPAGASGGEVDMTSAAIEALNAAGLHHSEAQAKAFKFLHEAQHPDGGWPEFLEESESNVASTAWVVQALFAAEENPETWEVNGKEPLGFMESMQRADGSLQYKAGNDENAVWMTAYAGIAFAGDYLPLQFVPPPANPPAQPIGAGNPPPSCTTASVAGEPGLGGESSQPGPGVIADGGAAGAPAFSRPQPQSRGHTPGGVRQLANDRRGARAAAGRNPGPRRNTSAQKTAAGSAKNERGASSKGSAGGAGSAELGEAAADAGGDGGGGGSGTVTGLVVGGQLSAFHGPLETGAPGLRGAGAGGDESPWPALTIAFAAAALALLGAHLERRRPRAIL